MLKNYLKIALRNILKYKGYSLINIFGLAIGMACCMVILLYVRHELSFDRFHSKAERIFRLNKIATSQDGVAEHHAISSGAMGPALTSNYAEVEQSLRVLPWFDEVLMTAGEKTLKVSNVVFADSNFFDVFDFHLLQGNPNTALAAPLSIVLSQQTATRFFGEQNPLGKTIVGQGDHLYTVTGVVENAPQNSHLDYNALVSWTTTVPGIGPLAFGWMNNMITQVDFTYLLLAHRDDAAALEAKLPDFMQRFFAERADQYQLYLQPLTNIYLQSAHILFTDRTRAGNGTYVYAFSGIALLILGIACINFINLATANASKRAREVGVRKVMGGLRAQLAQQFLGEAVLYSLAALVIALMLVEVTLSRVNFFASQDISLHLWSEPVSLLAVLAMALLVGLLAGSYPTLVLSRFQPIAALKNSTTSRAKGSVFRKVLVASQFTISIMLIVGTLVVYQQMHFLRSKNLGFEKEQLLVLPIGNTEISNHFQAFKNELLSHPAVLSAAGSNSIPGGGGMSFTILPEGKPETERWSSVGMRVDDFDLLNTYGIKLHAGRFFSPDFPSDSTRAVMINQTLARSLGWDDPVGKRLDISGELSGGRVIGVVEDFHLRSLRNKIEPLVIYFAPRYENITLRFSTANIPALLDFLAEKWRAFEQRHPFEYQFLDQKLAQLYISEQQLLEIFGVFAALAIVIACMGLLGLAAFAAEQRTKEIGVRKVLGASVASVTALLSRDFVTLVLLANVLAWPLAWLAMHRWLENFAYRVEIAWWVFALAGTLALLIALLTVSTQAIRAALVNPVESLRCE